MGFIYIVYFFVKISNSNEKECKICFYYTHQFQAKIRHSIDVNTRNPSTTRSNFQDFVASKKSFAAHLFSIICFKALFESEEILKILSRCRKVSCTALLTLINVEKYAIVYFLHLYYKIPWLMK